MNLYFLVEDGKSGQKIINEWISVLLPSLTRKLNIVDIDTNSYVLNSGLGYPRIIGINSSSPEKNVLGDTIDTININKNIDYLVLLLDGDDEGVQKRKKIVEESISNYKNEITCKYKIIIQNKCIETWLLGNDKMFIEPYSDDFKNYVLNYDIRYLDPENMNKQEGHKAPTDAIYHEKYLKSMLKEIGINYTKSNPPAIVYTFDYLNELKDRVSNTEHLESLKEFFDFVDYIN